MPYESHFVDGGKGVHTYGRGVVTSNDLLARALQRTLDHERNERRLVKYGLVDFTEMTEMQVSRETVTQLIEINRKMAIFSTGAFIAIVAPDELAFGMSRLWASHAEQIGWHANVFRNRESAEQWLRTQLGSGNPDNCSFEEYPSLRPVISSS